jgi:hypothetical protein
MLFLAQAETTSLCTNLKANYNKTEPGAFPESFIFLGGTGNIGGSNSWPEPEPRWSEAFNDWGAAWPLHIYIFGLCYTFAFIFATVCILSIIKKFKELKANYNILQYKVTALKSSAIAFCFQVVSFSSIIESPDINQPICWIIYTY